MNACKHWKSEVDCEMTELLIVRYRQELDWIYSEKRAALPVNDTLAELRALKKIEKAERDNFIPVGFRKRRVQFPVA